MSWSSGVRVSYLLLSLVVSLLLLFVSTLLFSRTGGILSHQDSLTHRSPRHARCILSRLRYNGHSLLLKCYRSRADRIENPSCSACSHSTQGTSSLILHCTAMWESLRCSVFGDSPSLYNLWSKPWGVAQLVGLQRVPPCLHPLERVGNNKNSSTLASSEILGTPLHPQVLCCFKNGGIIF